MFRHMGSRLRACVPGPTARSGSSVTSSPSDLYARVLTECFCSLVLTKVFLYTCRRVSRLFFFLMLHYDSISHSTCSTFSLFHFHLRGSSMRITYVDVNKKALAKVCKRNQNMTLL